MSLLAFKTYCLNGSVSGFAQKILSSKSSDW